MLKEGAKAPQSLKKYLGKYLVLYFYPKDNTPGCTMEACSFRDFNAEIEDLGAKIVGISKDSLDSHEKFQNKHKLPFELIADEDLELQKAFGVWVEKSMFGKKYMGTQRATFVIDPEGIIIKVWEKVSPLNHAKEVFEFLKTQV